MKIDAVGASTGADDAETGDGGCGTDDPPGAGDGGMICLLRGLSGLGPARSEAIVGVGDETGLSWR